MLLALTGCLDLGDATPDDYGPESMGESALTASAARAKVIANVDEGGGVYLANRPGGYYMGRLFIGWHFDREGSWYLSSENGTDYAWAMAWGHSDACLWVGPSRGQSGETAGKWASTSTPGTSARCDDAHKAWLRDGANLASHMNCPEPSNASNGTEKVLTQDAPFYWNVTWSGGAMGYDGGEARDLAKTIPEGTHVWYRYTTLDGKHMVVFVPGTGWGFMPVGVLDRSHTGSWSKPTDPGTRYPC